MKFVCPKCMKRFSIGELGTAVCPQGHSFDRSREGYYNLLLSSASGTHGDNREMVEARRRFLDTGAYLPLAKRIAEAVLNFIDCGGAILDVGCGEGYYTNIIEGLLSEKQIKAEFSGFDISKDAVRLAAKKNKNLSLAVASAYKMPLPDECFEVVCNFFSPLAVAEILRVLKPGGKFIMAIPGENHLFGLKKAVYDTPYKNDVLDSKIDGFSLVSTERISYTLNLDSKEQISNLFMMTPYAYRTGKKERERLFELDTLSTEIEFILFVYEKA